MKRYKAKYNPKLNKGVYGISLVENPAMEGHFIALSKEEQPILFKTIDEEQRIVAGLVLEPNKDIYRNQGGEEFYISFEADTIKELCYAFTKNQNNSNSTLEHENKIEGVTFVENWLVRDEKMDTSLALGFEAKKDSWVSVSKIDNDEVWNDYVKTGKVKGFSIDALLSLEEVNLNKHNMSTEQEKTIWDMLKDLPNQIALALTPKVEIKLGSVKLADGSLTLEFEGDVLTVGGSVWITAEDGTKVPVPVGEHALEDGTTLIVTEEGVAGEVKAVEEENAPVPMEEVTAPASNNDAQIAEEISTAIKSILIKYSKQEERITKVESENVELKSQLVELGLKPASEGIKQPDNISFDLSKLSKKERLTLAIRN